MFFHTVCASFATSTPKVQLSERSWSSLYKLPDLWSPNSPDLNPIDWKIWDTLSTSPEYKSAGGERFDAASEWCVGWSGKERYYVLPLRVGTLSDDARLTTSVVCLTSVAYIVNIHDAHSYWKQGALGAARVRDGLQLGRSVRCTAGGGILCRHAHSLFSGRTPQSGVSWYLNLLTGRKSASPAGATRCTDSREIWHNQGTHRSAWSHEIRQSVHGGGNAAPKYQNFPLFGQESPRRGEPLDRSLKFLRAFIRPIVLH